MLSRMLSGFFKSTDAVLRVLPHEVPKVEQVAEVPGVTPAAGLPNAGQARSGITFAVDNVTPAGNPIWSETLVNSLSCRFKREILVLPNAECPSLTPK